MSMSYVNAPFKKTEKGHLLCLKMLKYSRQKIT